MTDEERKGFEAWVWAAFALGIATAGLALFLGLRPGGVAPILAYRWGMLLLGGASAALLLFGLLWCLLRRPVLQRGRAGALTALGACLWFCSFPLAYPSSHEGHPSRVRFHLPFSGEALVRFGGERRETNRLLFDPSRRFGVCFEPLSHEGLSVVAPASGRIERIDETLSGQTIVIEVATGEFLFLGTLERSPAAVAPAERVEAGSLLGRAASRLFVHLQDSPQPGRGEGVPMRFWHYVADGRTVETGIPLPGQSVRGAEGCADGQR